jgi:hypothetical protein
MATGNRSRLLPAFAAIGARYCLRSSMREKLGYNRAGLRMLKLAYTRFL